MIYFDFSGHFREGCTPELFLIWAFVFELQDDKVGKKWILGIFRSPKQHEYIYFFLQFLFFVNFYRCQKSTIRYKIVFLKKICSGGGQKTPKTRFFVKNEFFGRHPNNFFKKKLFYTLYCPSYSNKSLQKIKIAKKNSV